MESDTAHWKFLPEGLDADDLQAVERQFEILLGREPENEEELAAWLGDESELGSRIGAELARRYIRMTCDTEDKEAKQAYLSLELKVMPKVKVLADRMDKKLLASPWVDALPAEEYCVLLRSRRAATEVFREENTELQKKESELQTRQQALMGSVSVEFEGESHTLQQMAPYYEDQDRERRQRAFEASLDARRPYWPELEDIFDQLVGLRDRIGRNAGFPSYTPFRFKELERFDYGPEECRRFHKAVEESVVPAVRRLDSIRRERLGLDRLRPWDLEVDLDGQPPFRPFTTQDELTTLVRRVFAEVDPRFDREFGLLVDNDLLDLMSRKGKAPGGYQYTLEDVRLPFIFVNGVGVHGDVQTLLHEGGHAFHSILSRHFDLKAYRHSPIEFAETASMSMELLGLENLGVVYSADAARRARRKHLEGILRILPWIASIDAFQHWVYEHPRHERDERKEAWLDIRARFAPDLDYRGHEDALAYQWTAQGHLFQHAFYYIEYGIAQIAALQMWQRYREDPDAAVAAYRKALALGGSRTLPDLFATCGVRFDFDPELLASLVADVESCLV